MIIQNLIILYETGTALISLILQALTCSPRLSTGHHSMAQTLRKAAKVKSHMHISYGSEEWGSNKLEMDFNQRALCK